MQASDIMTPRVISISSDATVVRAIRTLLQNHVSGLPVVEADGTLVGIVTEGDLLRRAEIGTEKMRPRWLELLVGPGQLAEDFTRSHGRKVAELMTSTVVSVPENAPLEDVVRLMERHRIKRIPVVKDGKIVGIIGRANLLHVLAQSIASQHPVTQSDLAIRKQIIEQIDRLTWAPSATINPLVNDGVVDLYGVILDERERRALCVVAENTPGVKAVKDHLVWIEPYSGFA